MSDIELVDAEAEKGWGMYFDARIEDRVIRFSITRETLTASILKKGGSGFPGIFESNLPLILDAALLLTKSGRLEARMNIGGTEIMEAHLREASAQQGVQGPTSPPSAGTRP